MILFKLIFSYLNIFFMNFNKICATYLINFMIYFDKNLTIKIILCNLLYFNIKYIIKYEILCKFK